MCESRGYVDDCSLYLDLMKRCLTDSIFMDHPLANMVPFRNNRPKSWPKRVAINGLMRLLRGFRLHLVEEYSTPVTKDYAGRSLDDIRRLRELGRDWPARAHTMIGLKRLDNLQSCVETVLQDGIPGDLIETGVWRGGASIFMRAVLAVHGDVSRTVWLADSFAGLPPPDFERYPVDADDPHFLYTQLAIPRTEVEENFRRYGLLDDRVRILEGWFKDTLPDAPIERLAVLRLDGDMYESTIQALDSLYRKVSPGGFVIVDDYALEGCRQAVSDFHQRHGITSNIRNIDDTGAFWRVQD